MGAAVNSRLLPPPPRPPVHVFPVGPVEDHAHSAVDFPAAAPLAECWLCELGICTQRYEGAQRSIVVHGTWAGA